jgi:hypothetical protein
MFPRTPDRDRDWSVEGVQQISGLHPPSGSAIHPVQVYPALDQLHSFWLVSFEFPLSKRSVLEWHGTWRARCIAGKCKPTRRDPKTNVMRLFWETEIFRRILIYISLSCLPMLLYKTGGWGARVWLDNFEERNSGWTRRSCGLVCWGTNHLVWSFAAHLISNWCYASVAPAAEMSIEGEWVNSTTPTGRDGGSTGKVSLRNSTQYSAEENYNAITKRM